jgi:flagellar basal-body rod protein FlgG
MNNRRLTKRKQAQLLVLLTILAAITLTLRHPYRREMRISESPLDLTQGVMQNTGNALDVGIEGLGFFRVKILGAPRDSAAYTRSGQFFVNSNNQLVVGMRSGYLLDPPLMIPNGMTNIQISRDGIITGSRPGAAMPTQIGQFKLVRFANPQGLQSLGEGLYRETEASGPAVDAIPGDQGSGMLLQCFLEAHHTTGRPL